MWNRNRPAIQRTLTCMGAALTAGLLALLLAGTAHAEPPSRFQYEGRLFDDAGAPLAGPVDLTLELWDAQSGGNSLYAETHAGVTLSDGAFSLAVGEGTSSGDAFAVDLLENEVFLEVTVGEDTLTPRHALHPTPQALVAVSVPGIEAEVAILETSVDAAQADATAAAATAATAQTNATAAQSQSATAIAAAASNSDSAAEIDDRLGDQQFLGTTEFSAMEYGSTEIVGLDMVAGGDGLPMIAVNSNDLRDSMMTPQGFIEVTRCGDPACRSRTTHHIDQGAYEWIPDPPPDDWDGWYFGTGFDDLAIAWGSDDALILLYRDKENHDLVLVHCGDASCDSGNTTQVLETGNGIGRGGSLAVGADGFPVMAYFRGTSLVVRDCDDLGCASSSNIVAAAGVGSVASTSSIAIPADGQPVVAFFNGSSFDLNFAKCLDPSCSGSAVWSLETAGDTGRDPAIAIGNDGLPVIAYRDASNDTVKFMMCEDASCSNRTVSIVVDDEIPEAGLDLAVTSSGRPVITFRYAEGESIDAVVCNGPPDLFPLADVDCSEIKSRYTLATGAAEGPAMMLEANGDPVAAYAPSDFSWYAVVAVAHNHDTLSNQIRENLNSADATSSAVATAQATAATAQATANTAQATANTAQAAVDALHACGTLIEVQVCPLGLGAENESAPNCDAVGVGAFCEGDNECGTSSALNNCGVYDWYFKTSN